MSDQLRDARVKGWFHIDHALMDEYGPKIGAVGIAVYAYICHRADRKGVSWPSYNTIAAALDISRSTAIREVRGLEHHGLIRIRTETPKGKRAHNVYTLVTIGVTDTPVSQVHQSALVSDSNQSHTDTNIGVTGTPVLVSQIDPNKNHVTRTNKQEPVRVSAPTRERRPLIPIPSEWDITEEDEVWLKEHGATLKWAMPRTELFVTHYESIEDTQQVRNSMEGWKSAWQKWMLKDLKEEATRSLRR